MTLAVAELPDPSEQVTLIVFTPGTSATLDPLARVQLVTPMLSVAV